ncbi:Pyruvate dehydrogenase E1 component [Planctomycetes bacterium Poly30]|uniref:Pyruvate dehydrogenase E1 component n=1 Tax=Saltatorellus ferox TaxID=2528018 RepID=A0A518ES10_9BACT|nr:Pyruvate dehydrogenase E1 component [Planctomycetes bacterium Poly30]
MGLHAPSVPEAHTMITAATPTEASSSVQEKITYRAFVQAMAMIHLANNRKDKEQGDPKVGGHPASCASAMHILSALHLEVRQPQDFVCCKPHASPVDHALHNLLGLFRHDEHVDWFEDDPKARGQAYFTEEESKKAMEGLRRFPTEKNPHVFQSYHARTDADHFHFLPSGTVGIPPVVSGYLALAYRYAKDHGWDVPEGAHFWSLIGDSEFREGSLLEAMPDLAERMLGNVTWIIDYNRQNLDGTRIPNERGLEGTDAERIEKTAIANGWRVIQVRHGKIRTALFKKKGGDALKEVLESGLTDYEFQMLALKRDAEAIRTMIAEKHPGAKPLLKASDDDTILRMLLDLGGHCYDTIRDALAKSREESGEPYMIIAHTLKGWGLECLADPANHSTLPKGEEVKGLVESAGLSFDDPFAHFAEDTEEAKYLAERRDLFRQSMDEHADLQKRNKAKVREAIDAAGGIPDSLDIDLSLFPLAHTQWMWGQIAAKLVRLGSSITDQRQKGKEGGRRKTDGQGPDLTEHEKRWATAAEFVMTMSPDVGTSTNISSVLNERIYGPDRADGQLHEKLDVQYKHPELIATQDAWTRHIRFEIAEANAMTAVGSFGKMAHYAGLPFFPIMTVYDFFIKRALDQLYYSLYWGAEFVVMGTPSGVTLSAEGAQHSWKSDIQIPNLITWEPLYAIEVDWILSDAIKRSMMDDNEGRRGVLIRAVTRGVQQKTMIAQLKTQARYKGHDAGLLAPKGADWEGATDESKVATVPDEEILKGVRDDVLAGGYYLVDYRGYAGYEPGDNVVHIFAMGSLADGAIAASKQLLERGVYANVIHVSSPELLFGILGHQSGYEHLRTGLGIDGNMHLVPSGEADASGLAGLAGRRVPIVAVCDGEAGLLDNIGSIVGVRQETLAVRKFSKCGRPSEIFEYQHLDAASIVEACGKVLSETAMEDIKVSASTLNRVAGAAPQGGIGHWRELWPDAPKG